MISEPPGRSHHVAAVIAALVIAWWASVPFSYAESAMVMTFVLAPLVLYWVSRFLVALTHDATAVRRRSRRWLLLPLIVLVLGATVSAGLPFEARFALSRSSMERFAQDVLRGGTRDLPVCARTGLFPVCGHVLAEDGLTGVELQISDWPLESSRCFVWAAHGQPRAADYEYGLRHLTGPWWGCRGWDGW